jgi:hypothetical protein
MSFIDAEPRLRANFLQHDDGIVADATVTRGATPDDGIDRIRSSRVGHAIRAYRHIFFKCASLWFFHQILGYEWQTSSQHGDRILGQRPERRERRSRDETTQNRIARARTSATDVESSLHINPSPPNSAGCRRYDPVHVTIDG